MKIGLVLLARAHGYITTNVWILGKTKSHQLAKASWSWKIFTKSKIFFICDGLEKQLLFTVQ